VYTSAFQPHRRAAATLREESSQKRMSGLADETLVKNAVEEIARRFGRSGVGPLEIASKTPRVYQHPIGVKKNSFNRHSHLSTLIQIAVTLR